MIDLQGFREDKGVEDYSWMGGRCKGRFTSLSFCKDNFTGISYPGGPAHPTFLGFP